MTNIHEYLFIQMWIISPLMWVSISVIYHHLNNLYKYYVSSHFQKQNFFPSLKFKGREQKSAGMSFFQILSLKATVSVGHNNLRLSVLFSPWKGKKKKSINHWDQCPESLMSNIQFSTLPGFQGNEASTPQNSGSAEDISKKHSIYV